MNQYEPWHDLHRLDHAEQAGLQRPETSPLRGSSRRSTFLAIAVVGVVVLVGGYFAFTAEENATYSSLEELAADLEEGGVPCDLKPRDFGPSSPFVDAEAGVCPSAAVTLAVYPTSEDMENALNQTFIEAPTLMGANWIIAANDPASDTHELETIQEVVGGTLTPAP